MMKLMVMTPKKKVVDLDVASVILQTKLGQITVLPGHDVTVTVLKEGWLEYSREVGGRYVKIHTGAGCAEIAHAHVMVFTVNAEEMRNDSGGHNARRSYESEL